MMPAVGDTVLLTWDVDPAYGGERRTFRGVVRKIDDWITVVNEKSTFHYPISTLAGIHVEQSAVVDNPFMSLAPPQENPFMALADNPFLYAR